LDCGLGGRQVVAVFFVAGSVIGLRLRQVLIGFGQVGFGFPQIVLLLVVSNSATTSPGSTRSPGWRMNVTFRESWATEGAVSISGFPLAGCRARIR